MKKLLLWALITLNFSFFCFAQDDVLWKKVVYAHHIVKGTIHVNKEKIIAIQNSKSEYYTVMIDVQEVLKGSVPTGTIALRLFIYCSSEYAPAENWHKEEKANVEYLMSLNNQTGIIFLYEADSRYSKGFFFSDYLRNSFLPLNKTNEEAVKKEIEKENDVLNNEAFFQSFQKDTYYKKVKKTIEKMLGALTARGAYRALEKMGQDAVPYIICLMNDRRELPVKHIVLKNHPDFWEATRQYSPELVVDVLAAILNQVTGESFGFIYNGDDTSEHQRQCTVNGWKIYLWHITHKP